MLRLNVSFKLIFASCSEFTLLAFKIGVLMFGFYVPCQIVLFSESGSAIIASESHVIALKVGDKLTNLRNAPLFITSVPNSLGSSFCHVHFVPTFTFVLSWISNFHFRFVKATWISNFYFLE